ncbi:prolipoprotein diacylglyceryl transferase [Pirellulaceae bacterium SH467]|jgi:phosphatidylglycerol:prolipoprotein diacylglycerol transferase
MRQTLFHIPHAFLGLPVFGLVSWGTLVLVVIAILALAAARTAELRESLLKNNGVVWGAMLLLNALLLPRIETRIDDWPVGLPVRGYGVLLMLGVLFGVWVALRRARTRGISTESFFSLATWTVVAGIVGARLFYVVQYWDEMEGDTLAAKLVSVLQITEGGLVVYGSVIGGLAAMIFWTLRHRVSILLVADAVTPAFFLGLAFGRIGCLLNGCCYGGVCETDLPSISFPAGSPVYEEQLSNGRILGIETEDRRIVSVKPDSWGAKKGIREGGRIDRLSWTPVDGPNPEEPLRRPAFEGVLVVDGQTYYIPSEEIPRSSVGVHPSQLYASAGGLVLFLWTAALSPFLSRTGTLFATGLIAYGVVRTMEEYIRVDEAGQFGTDLSISQWISAIGIAIGLTIWLFAFLPKRPGENATSVAPGR